MKTGTVLTEVVANCDRLSKRRFFNSLRICHVARQALEGVVDE